MNRLHIHQLSLLYIIPQKSGFMNRLLMVLAGFSSKTVSLYSCYCMSIALVPGFYVATVRRVSEASPISTAAMKEMRPVDQEHYFSKGGNLWNIQQMFQKMLVLPFGIRLQASWLQ